MADNTILLNKKVSVEVVFKLIILVVLLKTLDLSAKFGNIDTGVTLFVDTFQLHLNLVQFGFELRLSCGIITP